MWESIRSYDWSPLRAMRFWSGGMASGAGRKISRGYEYRSIAIAANHTLSGWDRNFRDQAMTAATIDRLVHHATILEMNTESFRQRAAASNQKTLDDAPTTTRNDNQTDGETRAGTPNDTPPPAGFKSGQGG